MLQLSSATFIASIKKRKSSPGTDAEVCTDDERYSRIIRCCQSFSPLFTLGLISSSSGDVRLIPGTVSESVGSGGV